MFLGGTSGEGLEPVGVMGSPVFHRPFADADSHTAGYLAMNGATVIDIVEQLLQHLLRDVLFHPLAGENVARKVIFYLTFRRNSRHRSVCFCNFDCFKSNILHNFDANFYF